MEGEGEIGLQGDHRDPGLQAQNREEGDESRSGRAKNVEGVGSANDHDNNEDQVPTRKKYHRHTTQQIHVLESFFKEFPHPDEEQRNSLSLQLGLKRRQIKFWFQNRRTQMKTRSERQENVILKQEHNRILAENEMLKEAMSHPLCTNCGSLVAMSSGGGGGINFEIERLRSENAQLKDDFNRICMLASRFLGLPISSLSPSDGEGTSAAAAAPPPMAAGVVGNRGIPFDKNVFVELAVAAMDILMKLAQPDTPLWIRTLDGGKEVLNREEYLTVFPPCLGIQPNGFVFEASRQSGVVLINSLALVETLMDSKRWAEMFPCMISGAGIIDIIARGADGTNDVLTPFIPVRQLKFIRFCKQHTEGLWSLVDVSVDINLEDTNAACRRLPSGCIVQDLPNNCSRVTWIEHSEYDEGVIQYLCRPLVRSGWGFGAQRWFANLQRQCECLSILMSTAEIAEHPSGIGPDGRKSILALAQRMMYNFSSGVCVSSLRKWDKLRVEGVPEDVRMLIRESWNDPGEPTGIVLSAATSIWLPTTKQRLFDFLSNERMRSHWDVLLIDGQLQGIAHIFKGHDAGNCVSILRYDGGNPADDPIILLQETRNDASGSLVVYTPLDLHSVNMVMGGTDSSMVVVLPSGFAIHPDGHSYHGTTSNYNEESNFNETAGGCILTVGFQILINNQPNNKISVESVDTVSKLITCTIQKINAAI
ncbi:hypothetical protein Dsin_014744 [Dipteronia sinensis]|uniref:Uncharacterized protein n=1 Tax=Dipteronia sinensis TaxID=43782 RepID=A0AAE0ANM9_9ROSI|nr:hypothetical protein Dsin_014744 [Dipteronia sinensis]